MYLNRKTVVQMFILKGLTVTLDVFKFLTCILVPPS